MGIHILWIAERLANQRNGQRRTSKRTSARFCSTVISILITNTTASPIDHTAWDQFRQSPVPASAYVPIWAGYATCGLRVLVGGWCPRVLVGRSDS